MMQNDGDNDGSVSGDDVSNVFVDLANTVTTINGMDSTDVNKEEVVTNLFGLGNLDVVEGGSGTTTTLKLGDIVNSVGSIQGQWYDFNIANVHVQVEDN